MDSKRIKRQRRAAKKIKELQQELYDINEEMLLYTPRDIFNNPKLTKRQKRKFTELVNTSIKRYLKAIHNSFSYNNEDLDFKGVSTLIGRALDQYIIRINESYILNELSYRELKSKRSDVIKTEIRSNIFSLDRQEEVYFL